MHQPSLERFEVDGLSMIVDPDARTRGLVVAFTDRLGGVSPAPYASLNLGRLTGDDARNVDANRDRVAHALGLDPRHIHRIRQVHGTRVVDRWGLPDGAAVEEADGIAIEGEGAAMVLAADCVPMVVSGANALVALHAGWRGLVAGAVGAAVSKAGPGAVAWVGPSIRACCYEVGPEVIGAFERAGLPVVDESHVDPGRAAADALGAAGVSSVTAWDECTCCATVGGPGSGPRFFSHRRDGVTGRQAGLVWLG
ncbi:MAG: polyphenol oxidase family protein [Actinomycetota bacterium]|nr:polyphenol oxidase family protein [Actinomycetota bacterium]